MFDAPISRYSIPFFFNGNHDMAVKCLNLKVDGFDSTSYEPITVGEHIRQRTVLSHVDL
jgi:isopenicillin N synthase-like dioxygenase